MQQEIPMDDQTEKYSDDNITDPGLDMDYANPSYPGSFLTGQGSILPLEELDPEILQTDNIPMNQDHMEVIEEDDEEMPIVRSVTVADKEEIKNPQLNVVGFEY